jgi:two-component system chemotaxis sensor kinase CheA
MGIKIEIDRELIEGFVDDATEALHAFESATVALRLGHKSETLEELFCAAHNLKGASMCIGLESFGEFMHRVEDVIQCMINGGVPQSERVVQVLLSAQRCLMTWIGSLTTNSTFVPETSELLKDLDSLVAQAEPRTVETVMLGELYQTDNPEEEDEEEEDNDDDLQALFEMHRKIYEEDLREREQREQDDGRKGEGSSESSESSAGSPRKFSSRHRDASQRSQETLRISAQKLDDLVQLISELSIHQGIIQEARRSDELASKGAVQALHVSLKLVKDIHAKARERRLQPLSGRMQKLERNAVDLAAMQGKRVKVILEGSDVQCDKTVLDKMSDPLVHVIRNAIDHGIELPAQRESEGKAGEAILKIVAIQDAGAVSIVISDDGRGMDDRAIFAAAVRKGVVPSDAQLSSDQIKKLIFIQGISTAPKLTEISGRGVGMDIVMRTVQSLRGMISITSTLGKGTTLAISLPTSFSMIDALVVHVQDARYAVPMSELTEIIDLSRYPIERTGRGGCILSLRGEVIPVEALADYMPLTTLPHVRGKVLLAGQSNRCPALLVRDGSQSVAFAIDRIVSQQQIVVRPLSDQLDGLHGLRGCAVLGDGEPGVILSLPDLARAYFSSAGGE